MILFLHERTITIRYAYIKTVPLFAVLRFNTMFAMIYMRVLYIEHVWHIVSIIFASKRCFGAIVIV